MSLTRAVLLVALVATVAGILLAGCGPALDVLQRTIRGALDNFGDLGRRRTSLVSGGWAAVAAFHGVLDIQRTAIRCARMWRSAGWIAHPGGRSWNSGCFP